MPSTAAPSTDSVLFQQILAEQKEAAINRLQGGHDQPNGALPAQKPETSTEGDENRYGLEMGLQAKPQPLTICFSFYLHDASTHQAPAENIWEIPSSPDHRAPVYTPRRFQASTASDLPSAQPVQHFSLPDESNNTVEDALKTQLLSECQGYEDTQPVGHLMIVPPPLSELQKSQYSTVDLPSTMSFPPTLPSAPEQTDSSAATNLNTPRRSARRSGGSEVATSPLAVREPPARSSPLIKSSPRVENSPKVRSSPRVKSLAREPTPPPTESPPKLTKRRPKRKSEALEDAKEIDSVTEKKRPKRKSKVLVDSEDEEGFGGEESQEDEYASDSPISPEKPAPKGKKRGRPAKKEAKAVEPKQPPKKRGRPKKSAAVVSEEDDEPIKDEEANAPDEAALIKPVEEVKSLPDSDEEDASFEATEEDTAIAEKQQTEEAPPEKKNPAVQATVISLLKQAHRPAVMPTAEKPTYRIGLSKRQRMPSLLKMVPKKE